MTDEKKSVFSSDKPLTDPAQDRFSRDKFAKMVATSIVEMDPEDGFVIGLYGKWGTGKTTLLNFVRHHLEQYPKKKQPIIIEFNPWWFSGEGNLTWHFLNHFSATLAGRNRKFYKAAARRIRSIADLLAIAPITGADIPQRLAGHLLDLDDASISNLKELVEKELNESHRKILFIIDDIDRLTADEIRELFRTMKAIANFPKVAYLVAFDDDVVAKALEDVQGQETSGGEYLEKIVQVVFHLPPALDVMLLFEEEIDKIFQPDNNPLWDRQRFENIYYRIQPQNLIKTPRNVFRFTNAVRFTYSGLIDEVNPIDFLLIEMLRIFYPNIYSEIWNRKSLFLSMTLGHDPITEVSAIRTTPEARIQHLARLLEVIPDYEARKIVKELLEHLFPILGSAREYFSNEHERYHKRVSEPAFFERYFLFALRDTQITHSELRGVLAHAPEPQKFKSTVLSYLDTEKLSSLADGLALYHNEISESDISGVVQTIVEIRHEHVLDWRVDGKLGVTARRLLEHCTPDVQSQILYNAINATGFGLKNVELMLEGVILPIMRRAPNLLTEDPQVKRLMDLALAEIEENSKSTLWLKSKANVSYLILWRHLTSQEHVLMWVREWFTTEKLVSLSDKEILTIIDDGIIYPHDIDLFARRYYFMDGWLELSDREVEAFVERALQGQYDESQQETVDSFVNEFRQRNTQESQD